MSTLVRFGNFTFAAEPIIAAPDSSAPGKLMGYRLKGPRGNKKVIAVDPVTGQPSAHELASLKLWIDCCNYVPSNRRKAH